MRSDLGEELVDEAEVPAARPAGVHRVRVAGALGGFTPLMLSEDGVPKRLSSSRFTSGKLQR